MPALANATSIALRALLCVESSVSRSVISVDDKTLVARPSSTARLPRMKVSSSISSAMSSTAWPLVSA
ncbi:hypothetical protein D3C76_1470630 [compost metagenome]